LKISKNLIKNKIKNIFLKHKNKQYFNIFFFSSVGPIVPYSLNLKVSYKEDSSIRE